MKSKLILSSLIVIAGITKAQVWVGPATPGTPTYRSGNVGIGPGMTSPTTLLDVDGGFTHMTYNTSVLAPSNGNGGLSVGWNRYAGMAEVDFYNVFNNPTRSFMFSQKTGASTAVDIMTMKGNGNVGIGIIEPSERLHLHDIATTGNTSLRITNGAVNSNGSAISGGYYVGLKNATAEAFHTQKAQKPILFYMPPTGGGADHEWMRLQHGGWIPPEDGGNTTDGFVGLNEPNPFFHLEINTPGQLNTSGELFIGVHPTDVPNSRMGMVNASNQNNYFLPTLFGNVDATQVGPALQTIADIKSAQDLTTSSIPVQRFVVTKDWSYNQTVGVGVVNRPIFSWQNAALVKMWMNAGGRLIVGNNLSTSTAIGNRFVIVSHTSDPYGGGSGLRLQNLTATSGLTPNGMNGVNNTNFLTVDNNGDVVLTGLPASSGNVAANNGLEVNSGNVQLGGNCANSTEVTAAELLTDREVFLNNKNLIFGENNTGSGKVGIGAIACTPGNLLEVSKGATNATSGLRMTDLAGATPFATNNQALSINASGDVILTSISGGGSGPSGPGNYCSMAVVPLTSNYQISTSSFNYNFTDDNSYTDKVNIGIPCKGNFPGKLNVTTAFPSDASGGNDSYSIYSTNTNGGNNNTNTGVYGSAISPQNGNIRTRGIWGYASSEVDARGVFGQGGPSAASYGGYFEALSQQGGTNYGIYAEAKNAGNNWAGWFEGDVNINGSLPPSAGTSAPGGPYALTVNGNALTTAGSWYLSDRRFKENIKPLENVLEKIKKLNGYNYTFKTDDFKEKNFNKGTQIGFIAQELKEVFPELVKDTKEGYLAVNYAQFTPILLEAVKQQQSKIETQQDQIDELKAMMQALSGKNNGDAKTTGISVNLSDKNSIVLNQNVPNPFAESTVISYNIPTDFTKAQIIFTTEEGKIINASEITVKGNGSITVFANDLSHGIYTYSLVVDGKTIDTKKMIKE